MPKIYEVHIIVPAKQEIDLFACFDALLRKTKAAHISDVRLTCALSKRGNFPRQPMITYLATVDVLQQAIDTSSVFTALMSTYGLEIGRVKAELQSIGTADRVVKGDDEYIEFHFKAKLANDEAKVFHTFEELEIECAKHHAAVFVNTYKKRGRTGMDFVVTQRFYDCGYSYAYEEVQKLLEHLKERGYGIDGDLTKEISEYDDNVLMDGGWLFKGDDVRDFITEKDINAKDSVAVSSKKRK